MSLYILISEGRGGGTTGTGTLVSLDMSALPDHLRFLVKVSWTPKTSVYSKGMENGL